jgi:mannose-6-phosphate isomerase class I
VRHSHRKYEPTPRYPAVGDDVQVGWGAVKAAIPPGPLVLAVDGPWILDWEAFATELARAVPHPRMIDLRTHLASWGEIGKRTESDVLADDPHFAPLCDAELSELIDELPVIDSESSLTVVFGPGAALVQHDVLWYADLPKRFAEAAVTGGTGGNLGQPPDTGPATTRRLFYIDWPILDRHRDGLAGRIDRWLDLRDPQVPVALTGEALRATAAGLVRAPFRTRPTFNTTSWGGHWGQDALGFNPEASNTALGYELIAPESGVLIGGQDAQVEVPFQLLVALHPAELLGPDVHEEFGTSFPIRFDYLDTVGGGNLSVHCHPQPTYMREVFGWPYTQHETYYMMVGGEGRKVFLGLRDGVEIERFQQQARHADQEAVPFDIERYVQTFPATPHQLFLVPAGTPHGSGEGNVVLEVSATPYLYSLRFYDWLRRDANNAQRAVHVEQAFHNLNTERTGDAVGRDLVQAPVVVRQGEGWAEERLGSLPEMFFAVHRIVLDADTPAPDDTAGRFHVLNVVDGDEVLITTDSGQDHVLRYAETLVVPASVGGYRITRQSPRRTRLVKSFVI